MTVTPEEAASLFDECRSSEALLAVEWTGGVMPDFFDATVIGVESVPLIVSFRRIGSGQEFHIDLSAARMIQRTDLASGNWELKVAFHDNSWIRFSTSRL
jgi:hypothetical protein